MNIKEALGQLDALDDDQWTQDGAPKTDVVSELVGKKVSRAEIIEAAPKFSRENQDLIDENEQKPQIIDDQEEPALVVIDTELLEAFAEMEPMLPQELADKVLKDLPKELLPEVEKLIIGQIAEMAARQKEMDEMNRKLKLSLATTRLWIKTLIPDMSNQQAIQAYIKASTENRNKKAKAVHDALGGMKITDLVKLDPRAAIDRAFARKTARGVQRPSR